MVPAAVRDRDLPDPVLQGQHCPGPSGTSQWKIVPTIEGYVEMASQDCSGHRISASRPGGTFLGGGIALMYALKYPQDLAGTDTVGSGARLLVHPLTLEALEKVIKDPGLKTL